MKSIDFSKPGGIPLTQDLLDYLQTANSEALEALLNPLNISSGGSNKGLIVSQMVQTKTLVSGTTYDYTCGAGWFFLNGELIRMVNSSVMSLDESTDDAYVEITGTSTPLTYNDGSTPNVINDVYGTLAARPIGTANSATLFLLKTTEKYGRENIEGHMAVSTLAADGGVAGDLYYRKNFLNNTLQLRALLGSSNAQNFATSSTIHAYVLCTLPEGYRPMSSKVFFTGEIKFIFTSRFKDDLGTGWLEQIVCVIDTAGNVCAYFVKPDISIANYSLEFFVILPLD